MPDDRLHLAVRPLVPVAASLDLLEVPMSEQQDEFDEALLSIVHSAIDGCPDPDEVRRVIAEVEGNRFGFALPTDEQEERLRRALGLPDR